MHRHIILICALILISISSSLVRLPAAKPKVLVLYDGYTSFGDVQYDVFRNLLSSHADIEYFYVPSLPEFLSAMMFLLSLF